MAWIYAIALNIFKFLIWVASSFHTKARLFHQGRINLLEKIAREWSTTQPCIWFHFASLGEFEQGRPVLEEIKKRYPNEKILITFYSPSGYEVRKNYSQADAVFYLPLDTPKNAFQFVGLIRPKIAIFTKYDLWPNYLKALSANKVPLFLISAIFRPNQAYFKPKNFFNPLNYFQNALKAVTHFFVQNQQSKFLLSSIGFQNVDVNGDTRLDRVYANAANSKKIELAEIFSENAKVLVAGSTWGPDEKIIAEFLSTHPDWKCIIAPHEVNDSHVKEISSQFTYSITYSTASQLDAAKIKEAQVLIIDNIGMLSSLYAYGEIAYIGGGFGAGIHNTLEAAAYGIPVIFGPKYQKFQEAKDLLEIGAAASIKNIAEFDNAMQELLKSEAHGFSANESNVKESSATRSKAGQAAANYVKENKGATDLILEKIAKYLD